MSLQRVLDHIGDEDVPLSPARLHMLSSLGREEMELFAERWRSLSSARRRQLIRTLVDIAEANFEVDFNSVFRLGLADEDEEVRAQAIDGLWEDESPGLVDAFLAMLRSDPSISVRAGAAMGLGRFVLLAELDELDEELGPRTVRDLWQVIEDPDESLEVRRRAVEAISFSSEEGVREIIDKAYRHSSEKMQISAVFSMGRSADPTWGSTIIAELGCPNPEMRYEAVRACSELELTEAVPMLVELISDPDREVQQAAIYALGQIGGQRARRALQLCCESDDEVVASAAADALSELEFTTGIFEIPLYGDED